MNSFLDTARNSGGTVDTSELLTARSCRSAVPASSRTVLVGLKGSNFSVGLEGLGKHLDAKDPTDIIFRNTVYWCWMKHPCGHIVVIVFAVKQPARQVPEPFRFTTISSIRDNLTGILSPGAGPSNAPPPPPCPAPAAGPVPNSAPTLTELANTLACLQARMDSAELGISVTDDRVTEVQNDMAQMERDMTAEANTAFNDKTQLMLRDLGRQIKNTFLHRV